MPEKEIHEQQPEIWKALKSPYNVKYSVSNKGRLRVKTKNGYKYRTGSLTSNYTHTKYVKVTVSHKGKSKTLMMHRLVAEAFIPNPDNKPMVNHKDLDGSNNKVENLKWVTASENMQHSADNRDNKQKELAEANRLRTVFNNKFLENKDLIGTVLTGRTLIGICYLPSKAIEWHGMFACHKCLKEFSAPLLQSFSRHDKGATQYCNNCSSKEKVKNINRINQD